MVKKNKVSYVSVPEDCGTLKVGSTKSNYHSQFMFFYMPLASIIDIRIYIRYFCIHTSGDFPRARPNGAALSEVLAWGEEIRCERVDKNWLAFSLRGLNQAHAYFVFVSVGCGIFM